MFSKILELLSPPEAPEAEGDARLAFAAILVRAARADDDYADAEKLALEDALAARYAVDRATAHDLRLAAEEAEAKATDFVRFTRVLKEDTPIGNRIEIMQALWSVILADGVRDADENALARQVASLLGVNDRDSALARRRVEEEGRS